MNAVIQKAISLNNIAVHMMEIGDYNSAINNLYHSLKPFRDVSSSSEQYYQSETSSSSSSTTSSQQRLRRSNNISIDEYMINTSSLECGTANTTTSMDIVDDDDEEQQQNFLYNHGIRIPGTIMNITYEECTLMSCVVVFNLALAHHHLFEEQRENNSNNNDIDNALKAKELYEIALNMHRDISTMNNDHHWGRRRR